MVDKKPTAKKFEVFLFWFLFTGKIVKFMHIAQYFSIIS